ncbi:DUF721 domain-containing protein [Thermanaerovibrio acidaminovorans]|uniref:DUF721 domain-containing protein n=1 Tax=Thermanaerovibrio acidaminovorans (strain ATCC 49978 / DSM 6589 / Su883) TaxID=525903 RepID=D1B7J3_THEAS|nr:DUF721 domain-containing protein [Thermanaerovibrio acidaminovorans]ACZ18246.1 protein of unknown function DUF721 [Thermanaerovibrio acidaminovorans DSM 6589]
MRSFREVISEARGEVRIGLGLAHLKRMWRGLVGEELGSRSRPASFERGCLLVVCSSSSARMKMMMCKKGVLVALRRLGLPVEDIRAVVGGGGFERPLEVKVSSPRPKARPRPQVDPEALERARERLAGLVSDPEILTALARLMALRGEG